MNITIVTPVSQKSAIAKISQIMSQLLKTKHLIIDIIASDVNSIIEEKNEYIQYSQYESVDKKLKNSDIIIYQIGNNYEFHAGVLFWMTLHPGIICLHDFYLHDLFESHRIEEHIDKFELYRQVSENEIHRADARAFTDIPLRFALGVFTHSAWGFASVASVCSSPVWVFPLCHPKPTLGSEVDNVQSLTYHNAKLKILTFGHINPNKKIDQVMEAIGLHAGLGNNISYQVVGPIEAALLLKYLQRAAELGIDVAFLGEVSDEVLDRELQSADVVVALRWPPLEAGSASVVEALWNGKPTIVTDAGCYRDLPDDVVIKISPDDTNQLGAALVSLLSSPDIRTNLGLRAQAYARLEFDPEIYAGRVAEFCELVLKKSFAMKAGISMVRQLGEWGMPQHNRALQLLAEKWNVFR